MLKKRTILQVERLEDRLVPTVTASYFDGSLYLTGKTNGALSIIGTGNPNEFQVTDNAVAVGAGTYTLTGNLLVSLQYEKGNVTLDLNGEEIPGNVLINLGVGQVAPATAPYNVSIYDGTGGGTGEIGGALTLTRGNGFESFNIGVNPVGPVQDPINIDSNLAIVASPGNSSLFGNQLIVGDGTNIYGSMSTTYVSEVAIGTNTNGAPLTTIGGSVNISDAGSLCFLSAVDVGVIQGSLNVVGTTHDDSFALQQATVGGGLVGGNINVNLGQGGSLGDRISLGANSEVDGSAFLTAGNNLVTNPLLAGDRFQLLGSVMLNAQVNMGNSKNSLYFGPQNLGDPTPFVGGSMTVTAGNGVNVIGQAATGEFDGQIDGNLTFRVGSGNNGSASDPMIIAPVVSPAAANPNGIGGTFTWISGNGMDYLQLGDSTTSNNTFNFNVNVQFGTKFCQFAIDLGNATAAFGTGTITGRVHGNNATDVFLIISGMKGTPFTSNF